MSSQLLRSAMTFVMLKIKSPDHRFTLLPRTRELPLARCVCAHGANASAAYNATRLEANAEGIRAMYKLRDPRALLKQVWVDDAALDASSKMFCVPVRAIIFRLHLWLNINYNELTFLLS